MKLVVVAASPTSVKMSVAQRFQRCLVCLLRFFEPSIQIQGLTPSGQGVDLFQRGTFDVPWLSSQLSAHLGKKGTPVAVKIFGFACSFIKKAQGLLDMALEKGLIRLLEPVYEGCIVSAEGFLELAGLLGRERHIDGFPTSAIPICSEAGP